MPALLTIESPVPKTSEQSVLALIARVISIFLGAVLLYSSLGKLQNGYSFLESVYQFEIAGPRMALAIAVVLPVFEFMLGLCLLVAVAYRPALAMSAGLFAIFSAALASVVIRGLTASCGCFGSLPQATVTWHTVARTSALFLLAVIGVVLQFLSPRQAH